MNINEIKPNPNNPRIIKDDKFKKLVKSIQDFPQMLELRPIVTYIFIFELCAINAWIAYYVYSRPSLVNNMDDLIRVTDIIFSGDEMAMLGGIIGFWFGSRSWAKNQGCGAETDHCCKRCFHFRGSARATIRKEKSDAYVNRLQTGCELVARITKGCDLK